jgi:inner membrane protein
VLRISDVHALDDVAPLRWGGTTRMFEPGSGMLGGAGVHVPLASVAANEPASFEATLTLRGSGGLFFAPVGLDSSATLRSDWPDPAFQGAWLPATREVTGEGFTARWRIPHVARGLPAAWPPGTFHDEELKSALFGVNFLAPVDPYRMTERSLKYSALIVGLTFVLLWLFEVAGGARVHPVQYLMLGASLCLFYLLELSLAEHFGFALAYLLASGAVTAQVTLYARSALDGAKPVALCLGVVALYGLLYVLLREDDYALLAGSATLFVLLSAVMFLTRRVRWDRSGEALAAK